MIHLNETIHFLKFLQQISISLERDNGEFPSNHTEECSSVLNGGLRSIDFSSKILLKLMDLFLDSLSNS